MTSGLWGVLATPFDDDLAVDLVSLQREVGSFAADGCDGLVALGVFGEAASLGPAEAANVSAESAASMALRRYGDPEEYADVAAFLCSERAAYVTGSVVRVDGGLVRGVA